MRKALNENPMVQAAVFGVCAIVFAVILFTSVLKGEEEPPAATTATPAATTSDPAPSTEAPGTASAPAPSAAESTEVPDPAATAPPAGGSPADGLLPSKGLPEDLLVAFAKNKTIALLVVDPKGTADEQVKGFTETLQARDDVEVFVVDVADIAKYSRITQGVSVSRAPALVVIRPRKLTGSVPVAAVSYGFRGPGSVNQAVDDALYEGKQVPSYP
jgi:hypothetical protein